MSKIFLCGITNGPVSKLQSLIEPSKDYFDGLVWTVDDKAPPDIFNYLNENKKEGKIIIHPFMKAHDWQANQYLHSGAIDLGDWVFICDTSDKINPVFLKRLREDINYWEKNQVNHVYLDRPLLFRFWGFQEFVFTPHWYVKGLAPQMINLSQMDGYRKENYIFNERNVNVGGIEHPIKYFLTYLRSNHCDLLYHQFGSDVAERHERKRIEFLTWWAKGLNRPLEIESFIEYFKEGIEKKNLSEFIILYIQLEVNIQDLIRYYILKQDFLNEICLNRFNWSFKKYYYDGIEHQSKNDDYIGPFNIYRLNQKLEME